MQRDGLFDMLLGMLAAKGRDETLFGGGLGVARQAFFRMAPKGSLVHAYFEIPLLGPPTLDVHCSVGHAQSAWPLDKDADSAWQAALRWFRKAGPFETKADEVIMMGEADTGTRRVSQSGMYLIQRERADLVAPFLVAMGEAHKAEAWRRFSQTLPRGWTTTYVGVFPGRPDGLLRVNARPASAYATDIEEALRSFGVARSGEAASLRRVLQAHASRVDVQLDVDGTGHSQGAFGMELYMDDIAAKPLLDGGFGARAIAVLEAAGLADGRWRLAAEACRSERISLPGERGPESIVVSVRPFSVKLKVLDSNPLPAKLYLRGDAGVLVPQGACGET